MTVARRRSTTTGSWQCSSCALGWRAAVQCSVQRCQWYVIGRGYVASLCVFSATINCHCLLTLHNH